MKCLRKFKWVKLPRKEMPELKGRLVPLVVPALYALITFRGQDRPKQTSITDSKTALINHFSFLFGLSGPYHEGEMKSILPNLTKTVPPGKCLFYFRKPVWKG